MLIDALHFFPVAYLFLINRYVMPLAFIVNLTGMFAPKQLARKKINVLSSLYLTVMVDRRQLLTLFIYLSPADVATLRIQIDVRASSS